MPPPQVDYCSSKFAAVGLDEALRVELSVQGHSDYIKTTVVCPYYISTGMFAGVYVSQGEGGVRGREATFKYDSHRLRKSRIDRWNKVQDSLKWIRATPMIFVLVVFYFC